jgi:hypothetical protein
MRPKPPAPDGAPDKPRDMAFLRNLVEFEDTPFALADDGSLFRIWMRCRAGRAGQDGREGRESLFERL